MEKFKRFTEIDYEKYEGEELEALYGLPKEVRFCSKCVISNQRPNSCEEYKNNKKAEKATIHLDGAGVCDACKTAEQKNTIDWEEREKELIELCDKYRSKDGSYDCLIPGSGGKDSFYQAHVLKYKYGMHPLTITWAPNIYTDWGWKNQQSWIRAGFDNILYTPNGKNHRLLTRLCSGESLPSISTFYFGAESISAQSSSYVSYSIDFLWRK